MSQKRLSAEDQMNLFEEALTRVFGKGGFPLAAVGDLTDLLFTLEKAVGLLGSVAGEENQKALCGKLYELEILLEEDLPMILEDLLPVTRQLRGAPTEPEEISS